MFKGDRQGELNGFLDRGSHIQGDLLFEDTFRIDGKVTGKVVSKGGSLVVGDRGEVEGEVTVGSAFVSGKLRGRVKGLARVEIAAGARVEGDIETPVLVIQEGAFFEGRSAMVESAPARQVSPKVTALNRT